MGSKKRTKEGSKVKDLCQSIFYCVGCMLYNPSHLGRELSQSAGTPMRIGSIFRRLVGSLNTQRIQIAASKGSSTCIKSKSSKSFSRRSLMNWLSRSSSIRGHRMIISFGKLLSSIFVPERRNYFFTPSLWDENFFLVHIFFSKNYLIITPSIIHPYFNFVNSYPLL